MNNQMQAFLDAMETRREEQELNNWWEQQNADEEWIKSNEGEDSGHESIRTK